MHQSGHRNCPICDSASYSNILDIDLELFDGHPMNGGYELVQCKECGFLYADTPVTQAQLDHYYTELSKYEDKTISTGGGYNENDRNRLRDVAVFLNKHIDDKNARILDLGCANGGLLRELKNMGFTNVVGIDPSAQCVEITKQDVGCECYQHSLFDIPGTVGKFDVVILSHVLEHVLSVRQTVAILDNLLRPDGFIYLECPNADNYYQVIHAPLQEFNTEHINHFSETSFRNLMGSFGFDTIVTMDKTLKIASDQDYHAVVGLFRKNSSTEPQRLQYDSTLLANINRYITDSNKIFDQIVAEIAALPSDIPIALFGIGQFAFKLIKTPALQKRKDYLLFDNNRMNVGKTINGTTIRHGSELVTEYGKRKFTIVITSLIHEKPIRKSIEDKFMDSGKTGPQILGFFHLLS